MNLHLGLELLLKYGSSAASRHPTILLILIGFHSPVDNMGSFLARSEPFLPRLNLVGGGELRGLLRHPSSLARYVSL